MGKFFLFADNNLMYELFQLSDNFLYLLITNISIILQQ